MVAAASAAAAASTAAVTVTDYWYPALLVKPQQSASVLAIDRADLTAFWKGAVISSSEHALVGTHYALALADMARVWIQLEKPERTGADVKIKEYATFVEVKSSQYHRRDVLADEIECLYVCVGVPL